MLVALALALIMFLVPASSGCRRVPRARLTARSRIVVAFLVLWVVMVFGAPRLGTGDVARARRPPRAPTRVAGRVRPPPWKVLVVAGVGHGAVRIVSNTSILWPDGYTRRTRRRWCSTSRRFRRTRSSSATTRAWCGAPGHAPPGDFADTSYQRLDDGTHHPGTLVTRRRRATCAA